MSLKKNSVLLDIDRSIIENNLLLKESNCDELQDLFPKKTQSSDDVPWKLVKPTPGICVKTRTPNGDKVFINVCQTSEIPEPEDIDEKRLMAIWSSDEHTSFRIPMSIGEAHVEEDKSGNPALVYDVAIHPEFFKKTEKSKLFRSFMLRVVMEGLQDKYTIQLETEDYVILKNRKAMGEIQHHRVRQGEKNKPSGPLIEEVYPPMQTITREPEYRIRHEPPDSEYPEYLLAEFLMKDLVNSHGVTLNVGEDRIIVETPGRLGQEPYKLDVFVPYSVDQEKCFANFNTDTKILSLKMPVLITN
ncbi:hypothetical protein L9F63_002219 [Diploptera punctata]|uniref:PIH1 domain-containing protein 1 n=1 Tax=Diploptera punctata TaxID=6984 RepID=A0AAD8A2J9_DIPPU|nr:hypothetical protein L9F63_002219 [Diploptera punctata]